MKVKTSNTRMALEIAQGTVNHKLDFCCVKRVTTFAAISGLRSIVWYRLFVKCLLSAIVGCW